MTDIRRSILWVIFGFSMVLLWDKWQVHNGNKATFFPATYRAKSSCNRRSRQASQWRRAHAICRARCTADCSSSLGTHCAPRNG
jgi:YidC/Oxa1 family membrane protein insertase